MKSLERNVPGQGKVTIHQDPRIEAMIGMERLATGEQKVKKSVVCFLFFLLTFNKVAKLRNL